MVKRLENPNVDDLGEGGAELTDYEFQTLLGILEKIGIGQEAIDAAMAVGFIAPLRRDSSTEEIFLWVEMPPDIRVLALCREGSLDAMKAYVQFLHDEKNWP